MTGSRVRLSGARILFIEGRDLKTSTVTVGDIKVAVDAMGGDFAPGAAVEGAVLAARSRGIPVLLVGDETLIRASLEKFPPQNPHIEILHAPESIGMLDKPVIGLRHKPDNSINLAIQSVVEGKAGVFFSAGNTGAVLVASVLISGKIRGIDRPAVATTLPAIKGTPVFLDAGANLQCGPHNLVQFAAMGAVYAKEILGVEKPKVAFLSNGTEKNKGTEALQQACDMMTPNDYFDFAGYIEGVSLMNGDIDVIVTDGFTGNLVLKSIEGVGAFMAENLADMVHGGALGKLGRALLKRRLDYLRDSIDYAKYGGAPLLGVRHPVTVAHGRSNAEAICNGIVKAAAFARAQYPEKLAALMQRRCGDSAHAGEAQNC